MRRITSTPCSCCFPSWRVTDASTRSTCFTFFKAEISAAGRREESRNAVFHAGKAQPWKNASARQCQKWRKFQGRRQQQQGYVMKNLSWHRETASSADPRKNIHRVFSAQRQCVLPVHPFAAEGAAGFYCPIF